MSAAAVDDDLGIFIRIFTLVATCYNPAQLPRIFWDFSTSSTNQIGETIS
jgi:hypothetical protein